MCTYSPAKKILNGKNKLNFHKKYQQDLHQYRSVFSADLLTTEQDCLNAYDHYKSYSKRLRFGYISRHKNVGRLAIDRLKRNFKKAAEFYIYKILVSGLSQASETLDPTILIMQLIVFYNGTFLPGEHPHLSNSMPLDFRLESSYRATEGNKAVSTLNTPLRLW